MRRYVSGTRNGVDWPAPGGEVDVPDDEGANLCEMGHAEPVRTTDRYERTVLPGKPEKR
jgi:hypothetical protein